MGMFWAVWDGTFAAGVPKDLISIHIKCLNITASHRTLEFCHSAPHKHHSAPYEYHIICEMLE